MTTVHENIIQRICECGWKAYLCGGAVRDMFINYDPHDFDIVTDALPEELKRIFPDKKVKLVGANFLVTLIDNVEVSTYRTDKNYGAGRHKCITAACDTLEEDLSRRDFTFNALAVCPYVGEVIDPFNGRRDLNNKIVRFVGNPEKRIYEDFLRMIRAARFACLIEGKLEAETFNAIVKNKHLVKQISPERIRTEVLKTMTYNKPSIFFDILHETGILEILFPELEKMYGHPGGRHPETLCVHFKLTGDNITKRDPILRLAGYLHDIGKPECFIDEKFIEHEKVGFELVEPLLKRYKFTNKELTRIATIVKMHMKSFDSLATTKSFRKLLRSFEQERISWKDWLRVKIADRKSNLGKQPYTKKDIKRVCIEIHQTKQIPQTAFSIKELDISGYDVMQLLQIKPGPEVGQALNYLFKIVLDEPELNNKETLLELVKENFC